MLIASVIGHVAVVKVLLEGGADVGRANNNGFTPRSLATVPEIIEMLDIAAQTQHSG